MVIILFEELNQYLYDTKKASFYPISCALAQPYCSQGCPSDVQILR
jgi:hypothetical protein